MCFCAKQFDDLLLKLNHISQILLQQLIIPLLSPAIQLRKAFAFWMSSSRSDAWYFQQTTSLSISQLQLLWDYIAADYRGAEETESVRSAAGAHTEMTPVPLRLRHSGLIWGIKLEDYWKWMWTFYSFIGIFCIRASATVPFSTAVEVRWDKL